MKEIDIKTKHNEFESFPGYKVVAVDSWKDFLELIKSGEIKNSGQYFRGQSENWWLCPGLYREVVTLYPIMDQLISKNFEEADIFNFGINKLILKCNLSSITDDHLKLFKLYSRSKVPMSFDADNHTDWWQYGQHIGLKTPMLDWTQKPAIALFFALSESFDRNREYCYVYSLSNMPFQLLDSAIRDNDLELKFPKLNELLSLSSYSIVVNQLTHVNNRLISQHGAFAVCSEIKKVEAIKYVIFEYWVSKLFEIAMEYNDKYPFLLRENEHFLINYKIKCNVNDQIDCLNYLNEFNINYSTLFPDSYGAAKQANLEQRQNLFKELFAFNDRLVRARNENQ